MAIQEENVELASLFIGLHHVPKEQLGEYVRSIARTLEPGDLFALRDHDATSEEFHHFVAMVHCIFNAATGVSYEEERTEIRNFKRLAEWTSLLERCGFERIERGPMVRGGDPTANSRLLFRRLEDAGLNAARKQAHDIPGYLREPSQTYLTAIE